MSYITDILYWISTGLLVPVIVLLIALFVRSLLLIGSLVKAITLLDLALFFLSSIGVNVIS